MPAQQNENFSPKVQALHKEYMQVVNDINEGNINLAMEKLKQIIDKNPNFLPAKQTYQHLLAHYGVNS